MLPRMLPRRQMGIRGSDHLGSNPLILLAPRDGFEPSTQRLTAACSTTELPGIRAGPEGGARHQTRWRPEAESNRCTRICSLGEHPFRELPETTISPKFQPSSDPILVLRLPCRSLRFPARLHRNCTRGAGAKSAGII